MATPEALLAANPFPGLRSFKPDESGVFFGRQQQIDDLLRRLGEVPLVAVAGASGCGKSSLVLAGLLRALERRHEEGDPQHWRPVVMRPGNAPIANLARPLAAALAPGQPEDPLRVAALAGRLRLGGVGLIEVVRLARLPKDVRVLVVVDQFEEIFRFRGLTDADECTAFVKLLVQAANEAHAPVQVVLTMRSDSLGACADFRDLPEAVSRGQFLVPKLKRDQRKQAITGPVEATGHVISPRLVQRVLNDVSDDFDDLPVMQHVLSCTWREWVKRTAGGEPIDIADYEAAGTAKRALSEHADRALGSLPGLEPVVERVFKALTQRVASAVDGVRRPLPLQQLCEVTGDDEAPVRAVIERYRRADTVFLLPPPEVPLAPETVIDISHESLIRGWTKLKAWVEQEALSAQTYRRIAEAAQRFKDGLEPLRSDPALKFELDWRDAQRPNAPWATLYGSDFEAAMRYLDQSRDAREAAAALAERSRRRKYWLAGGAFFGMVAVAVVMAGLWYQSVKAREAAALALEQATLSAEKLKSTNAEVKQRAESRRLALASSNMRSARKLDAALLLGSASLQVQPSAEEAQEIMRAALLDAPLRLLRGHGGQVTGLAFSADSARLASAASDGSVFLWDAASGKTLQAEQRVPDPQHDALVGFDAAGRLLVSPPGAAASDPAPGAEGSEAPVAGPLSSVAPSVLDGTHALLAAAEPGAGIRLRDLRTDKPLGELPLDGGEANRLALSADGRWLAAALRDGGLLLWDRAAARATPRRLAGSLRVSSMAFSPDGATLAIAGADKSLALWSPASARLLRKLPALAAPAEIAAYSPDGGWLAWADAEGGLMVWDVAAGALRKSTEKAHASRVTSLAFSHDGRLLASGSLDETVALWALDETPTLLRRLQAHHGSVKLLAFSPNGHALASAGDDGAVVLWDVAEASARYGVFSPSLEAVAAVAFDPSGRQLALAGEDSFVWLWDVARGRAQPVQLRGPDDSLTSIAYSADGSMLAAGSEDHKIALWDAASGRPAGMLLEVGHQRRVSAVAFSPDGRVLASGGRDNMVLLWDLATREWQQLPTTHHDEINSLAFSPDGQLLAIASRDWTLTVWDRQRGAVAGPPIKAGAGFTSVAFTRDGRLLAAASLDGTVKFWDPATRAAAGPIWKQPAGVTGIAFDPSGQRLVSGSSDGTVRLWDVAKRQPIGEPFEAHDDAVFSVAFRPDGKTVASAGADRRVVVWDVDVANWPQRACAIVNRDVDAEVWPRNLRSLMAERKVCPR